MTRAVIPQPLRIERAARDSTAWLPNGELWHANGALPAADEDPLAAAKGIALGSLIMHVAYVSAALLWVWCA